MLYIYLFIMNTFQILYNQIPHHAKKKNLKILRKIIMINYGNPEQESRVNVFTVNKHAKYS